MSTNLFLVESGSGRLLKENGSFLGLENILATGGVVALSGTCRGAAFVSATLSWKSVLRAEVDKPGFFVDQIFARLRSRFTRPLITPTVQSIKGK